MEQRNIPALDSLRAFAALSVCLFHFICTTIGFIDTKWIVDLFGFGQYGVQLFFVISGFVIPWAMYNARYNLRNFFGFILKRLARLEPPYFFSILIALTILWLRQNYYDGGSAQDFTSTKQVFLHLGYLIPFFRDYHWLNQVYWTLAVEFQYYLFIALLYMPLVGSRLMGRLLIYLLIIFISRVGSDNFLPFWLPFFLLGILLFLFKTALIKKFEYFATSLLVVLYCFMTFPFGAIVYAIIPVIVVLFFPELRITILHSMGKFSYSLYLIHPLIGASLINVLSHYSTGLWPKLLVILSGLAVTLLGAWLTYVFIEKPSKRLSASIQYIHTGN